MFPLNCCSVPGAGPFIMYISCPPDPYCKKSLIPGGELGIEIPIFLNF